MGKLILISGENNSGKSIFAEQLAGRISGDKYYIATMLAETEENHKRIEKHRRQRMTLGFTTLELPYQVGDAPVTPESMVLLEDISNLLANNIFDKGKSEEAVFNDICRLLKRCRITEAVTVSGLEDTGFDGETADYINRLNRLNKKLSDMADVSVIMQDNAPVYQKGEINEIA